MKTFLVALAATTFVSIHWTELSPMPHPEAGGATGWVGGELVVAGGTAWQGDRKLWLSLTQVYDNKNRTWRDGPNLPHAAAYAPSVYSSSYLEVFGGTDGTTVHRDSWKLDADKTRWTRSGTVPADVLLGRAALVEDEVFLFGGCPDAADLTRCSDAVWKRSRDGSWSKAAQLPDGPLAMPAAAVHDRTVYLFGGCSMPEKDKVQNHDRAFAFDTRTKRWAKLPPVPHAVRGMSAVALGGRVYLLGGYTDEGFSAKVFVFDMKSRTYSTAAGLPRPMLGIDFVSDGAALFGAGGEDKARSRSGSLFLAEIPR